MAMNIATIDIGTNSTLLLIAEYDGHTLSPVCNRVEITRLGQGVGKTGKFHPEAVERTFETLKEYKQLCNEYHVTEVLIGGTSAMRDAGNGPDFIARVQEELHWDIQILSGDDEARLTFLATRHEFSELGGDLLVIDIGGGSTEFIAGNTDKLRFMKSLDVGTVRFTEKFIENDPPSKDEIAIARKKIQEHLSRELQDPKIKSDQSTLVGVAGTVTTLLAVQKQMKEYKPEKIHKQPLTFEQINQLCDLFCSISYDERKELPGLQPKRADVIIMGTVILQEIMKHFNFTTLLVNDRGVRYGLLYEWLEKQQQ